MEHYEFELQEDFDKMDIKYYLERATSEIKRRNGGNHIEFELQEETFNRRFNDYIGNFEKYRVLNAGRIIGYLEFFRSNSYDYLNIYTSPLG